MNSLVPVKDNIYTSEEIFFFFQCWYPDSFLSLIFYHGAFNNGEYFFCFQLLCALRNNIKIEAKYFIRFVSFKIVLCKLNYAATVFCCEHLAAWSILIIS